MSSMLSGKGIVSARGTIISRVMDFREGDTSGDASVEGAIDSWASLFSCSEGGSGASDGAVASSAGIDAILNVTKEK